MQTSDQTEIQAAIIEIVKRHAVFNQDHVSTDSRLRRDHGIDSIKMVELVVELEEEFDIEVDSGSLSFENFATIDLITDYVTGKLNSKVEK